MDIPRYAIFRNRKVRIDRYTEDGMFRIIDTDDTARTVHRSQLKMLKERKK